MGRWVPYLWSGWLAATVLLAGTRFHPLPAGRIALALVATGFAVFTIGRRGRQDPHPDGARAFALAYYGGYGMMLTAALLTTAVAVGEWIV